MPALRRLLQALVLPLALLAGGCSSDGGGGVSFGHPDFYAGRANAWEEATDVEVIAQNGTDSPIWIKRLDLSLSAAGADLASGVWEGNRQIDPGSAVLLGISLPTVEGAHLPETDAPGQLRIHCRFARSGVIGLLGGESRDYQIPIAIRRGRATPPE